MKLKQISTKEKEKENQKNPLSPKKYSKKLYTMKQRIKVIVHVALFWHYVWKWNKTFMKTALLSAVYAAE